MSYVYIQTERAGQYGPDCADLFTVGFYDPAGEFQPESDHSTRELAAARANWLNGGTERAALRELFKHCAMIHKHWGESSNAREAEAAIRNAQALIG